MKPGDMLARSLIENHPAEAARVLEAGDPSESAKLLKRLPGGVTGPVIARVAPAAAGAILSKLGEDATRELLAELEPRDAAAIYGYLDEAIRATALTGMSEEKSRKLRLLLTYPPESAGALMDPQAVALTSDQTVQEAISALRRGRRQATYYLYVTDRDRKLVGIVTLRDLLFGAPREKIDALMKRSPVSVPVTTDREEVMALMRERRFLALPVVDGDGRLVGVVAQEAAVEAAQAEAFEDLQRMAGAGADEHALSSVSTVVRRRLPWLMVNLLTAFLAAAVIGVFEGVVARVTALAVLLPIVAGQGGNTGSQTLAVVMRGLALREILPGTLRRLVLKELGAGLLNGLAIALVTAGAVYAWDRRWALAVVIGASMIVNMVTAALAGAAIPVVLKSIGRDPAQSSGIFLTTVTDVVGFAAFLGLALAMEASLR
ncbi:MAG: magnesium transporter [Planctomycetia bacterium]|nr:magnesium transporter [Planctomycetia bacterium]